MTKIITSFFFLPHNCTFTIDVFYKNLKPTQPTASQSAACRSWPPAASQCDISMFLSSHCINLFLFLNGPLPVSTHKVLQTVAWIPGASIKENTMVFLPKPHFYRIISDLLLAFVSFLRLYATLNDIRITSPLTSTVTQAACGSYFNIQQQPSRLHSSTEGDSAYHCCRVKTRLPWTPQTDLFLAEQQVLFVSVHWVFKGWLSPEDSRVYNEIILYLKLHDKKKKERMRDTL